MIPFIYCTVITALAIDYLKEGLDTPPLGVLELRSEYEIGYIFKTIHSDETIKDSRLIPCLS